jgi:hypothetical protein
MLKVENERTVTTPTHLPDLRMFAFQCRFTLPIVYYSLESIIHKQMQIFALRYVITEAKTNLWATDSIADHIHNYGFKSTMC